MTASRSASVPLVRLDACDPCRGGRSFGFAGLRRLIRAERPAEVMPALGAVEAAARAGLHAVGFVAYEAASAFDAALATHPPDPRLPLAWFAVFAERRPAGPLPDAGGHFALGEWRASLDEPTYARQVDRIRGWIAAGDTYQVNHTLRLRAAFAGDATALYGRLCRAQQAGYCAFLDLGSHAIVSASPELFFRWAGERLELRPMKGTRPRGRWAAEDRALAQELLSSPKERAENLMIVDLLRNDAGRVAEFGSVRVPRLFEAERYPTVHQLTSTVRARTRPGTSLADLFRALFPSGSVTGAPKVRTMQIIRELEDAPRGVYTGAIGFVSPGEAVFSVAIRTLVVDRARGTAELGVGSGITYDAVAGAEYRECLAKAAFVRHEPREFRLLETLRYEPGTGYFLLDEHLRRLAASAEYFGFRCDVVAARARLAEAAAGWREARRVRLLLARCGELGLEHGPLPNEGGVVRVCVAAEPVDSRDPLLYHKTTARAAYEARRAAHPDCEDVLLVNERGELTESTQANLVVQLQGVACTPPLEAGLLPGVFREHLLRSGRIRERVLRPADLARAEAVYLVNSVRKWRTAVVVR